MSSAFQNEAKILHYVGPHFDPQADYTENTKLLISGLIRSGGQKQAVIAVNEVIQLVKSRISNPKVRPAFCDLSQQRAFLVWLQSLRQQLGPDIKMSKPKRLSRGLQAEARRRKRESEEQRKARTKVGLLAYERQIEMAKGTRR